MSLVVLASPGHAPGVTSTALGLALTWPRDVLLVDTDNHPSQSVLAGYLQGEDAGDKGLWEILSAHRERRPLNAAVTEASLALPAGDEPSRRFLPGFAHPGMVDLFGAAWPEFAAVLAAQERDVVVDAGAVGVRGLPPSLAQEADRVVVVTRSTLVALAGLRLYLPLVTDTVPAERLSLLVIGPGRPYTCREIGEQFGVAVVESVEWAPADAAVWAHGEPPRRGFETSGYVTGVRRVAAGLRERLDGRRARIEAAR